jgi:hypothetical protein
MYPYIDESSPSFNKIYGNLERGGGPLDKDLYYTDFHEGPIITPFDSLIMKTPDLVAIYQILHVKYESKRSDRYDIQILANNKNLETDENGIKLINAN